MKVFWTFLLALSFILGASPAALAQTSQFKGWRVIKRELSNRIAQSGTYLNMDPFLPAEGLEVLLGTWNNFGSEHTFQNGTPNPVNMLILNVTLTRFSQRIGASCHSTQLLFNQRFQRSLQQLCQWPSQDATADAKLREFWILMMGYSAPESEYSVWKEFFLTSKYRQLPAAETISAMSLAIVMNPYFLLHR